MDRDSRDSQLGTKSQIRDGQRQTAGRNKSYKSQKDRQLGINGIGGER